jgi:hypothetical protein
MKLASLSLVALLLTGCSSVGPMGWFLGKDDDCSPDSKPICIKITGVHYATKER